MTTTLSVMHLALGMDTTLSIMHLAVGGMITTWHGMRITLVVISTVVEAFSGDVFLA